MQTEPHPLTQQLAEAEDPCALLDQYQNDLQNRPLAEEIGRILKSSADQSLLTDLDRTRHYAHTLHHLADLTENREFHALAHRVAGNVAMWGENDYPGSITHYDKAAAIYLSAGNLLAWANSQVGKIVSLGYVGKLPEALTLAAEVQPVLEQHEQWEAAYRLQMNLSVLHSRRGLIREALALLNTARTIVFNHQLDRYLADVEVNRSNMLRDLGQLESAETAALTAEKIYTERNQPRLITIATSSRALTYLAWNRYNESLALFDRTRESYIEQGCIGDAIWVDLHITGVFLQLGRYRDVLRLIADSRRHFDSLGVPRELAFAILNEAVAHAALGQIDKARDSFHEAHALFETDNNPGDAALSRLELASVLLRTGESAEAHHIAKDCIQTFADLESPLREAQAQLVVAGAQLALGQLDDLPTQLDRVENIANEHAVLWLAHQANTIRSDLHRQNGNLPAALTTIDQAIKDLERLRGRLMTEFRADFLTDKQRVYADAVLLSLQTDDPLRALDYVERAKSRALIDLIANRLDLRITPRAEADREAVEHLRTLQDNHNTLYRRWMQGDSTDTTATRHELLALENEITDLWHKLMVQNADYARDAALTNFQSEPIQPLLAAGTLLLEFFTIDTDLYCFLITTDTIHTHRYPDIMRKVAGLLRRFNLNVKAATTSPPERTPTLTRGAQQTLQQLHRLLIAPIAPFLNGSVPSIDAAPHLIIVPHGAALHYLPFHALYDGAAYLCEKHTISYLPTASLLRHSQSRSVRAGNRFAIGYSNNNLLPFAAEEAETVAEILNGTAITESAATIAAVRDSGVDAGILHLSTHGDFNQENPLFSGLSLADGQLGTLDIFNLELNAGLVTLSACQTGRSVVGGGDELMGMMRAFLYAGASSLLVSLWPVYDRSTMLWMQSFYRSLVQQNDADQNPAGFIQSTQKKFIHATNNLPAHYAHPGFWAPFILVGGA